MEIEKDIEKLYNKIASERQAFLKEMINKHCYLWQKIYIKLAIKFNLNIWFIEHCIQNLPNDYDSYLMRANMSIHQRYGVEINNKIYWMNETYIDC